VYRWCWLHIGWACLGVGITEFALAAGQDDLAAVLWPQQQDLNIPQMGDMQADQHAIAGHRLSLNLQLYFALVSFGERAQAPFSRAFGLVPKWPDRLGKIRAVPLFFLLMGT